MALQSMMIAPFQTGLDNDDEPWIAPEDAFTEADNVHVRNGYVEKRSGYREFGTLQKLDTPLAITGITQANPGVVTVGSTATLTTGDKVYIWGVGGMTQVNDHYFTITVLTGTTFSIGVDTTAYGAYTAGGNAALNIDDTDRVMGIQRYLSSSGSQTTLAFNTTRANIYDSSLEKFLALDSSQIMSGGHYDYIWSVNWQSTALNNRMYFTNGVAYDGSKNGIRYYDAVTNPDATTLFTPDLNAGATRKLYGGKLLFVINQRLVVLYTYELNGTVQTAPNRARWCAFQGPSNWKDDVPGGGGFLDAATGDQILSARQLQNQIIVFFTNSIWSLVPVSDPFTPFKWVKLNDFRACDGKMASISYDREARALGFRGIIGCNGVESERVDRKILQFTVNEINADEFQKVFCIRSYANQRWITLYPPKNDTENKSALVFDDFSGAWTTYTLEMNCLGYGNTSLDYAAQDFTAANNLDIAAQDLTTETALSFFWSDKQEMLLGGDINGNVYVMEEGGSDGWVGSTIGTEIVSTLSTVEWNPYKAQGVESLLSYVDIYVNTDQNTTAKVDFYKDDDQDPYQSTSIDFLPNLTFVASINYILQSNPAEVSAPNHGLVDGDVIYIYGVQGMEAINDPASGYTVTVIDSDYFTINVDSSGFDAFTKGGGIYRRRFYKTKTWKRAYAGGIGYAHSMTITCGGTNTPMRISAFKPQFAPKGTRIYN